MPTLFSCDVPATVIDEWGFRRQYIGQGELLAGPVALHLLEDELSGKSIFWFIDNQSALTAMIKGASPIQDNSAMALVLALQMARAMIHCWYEFVDSKANPADGLSRDGWKDEEVAHHLASGK